jgi:hypothetical protein
MAVTNTNQQGANIQLNKRNILLKLISVTVYDTTPRLLQKNQCFECLVGRVTKGESLHIRCFLFMEPFIAYN